MKIWQFTTQPKSGKMIDNLDVLLEESFASQPVLDDDFNTNFWNAMKGKSNQNSLGESLDSIRTNLDQDKDVPSIKGKPWFRWFNLKKRGFVIAAATLLIILGFTIFNQPIMNAVAEATQKIVIYVKGGEEFSVSSQSVNQTGGIIKPNKEYGVNDYPILLKDIKGLPYKSYVLPMFIPQGYKYKDAAYFLMDNFSLVEGTTLYSANQHTIQISYRNKYSCYAVAENIDIKKDMIKTLPKKEADSLRIGTKLLIPGLNASKVNFNEKEAIIGVREDKETITQLLMVPVDRGYISVAYNSKINDYNALTIGEKTQIKDNLNKIADSMLNK